MNAPWWWPEGDSPDDRWAQALVLTWIVLALTVPAAVIVLAVDVVVNR